MSNDKYARAQEVLRREIPNLSQDAAARILDALLDATEEDRANRVINVLRPATTKTGSAGGKQR